MGVAAETFEMPFLARVRDFTDEQVRDGALRAADEEAGRKNMAAVAAVVEAAAPLILAAYREALLADAFPDEDSDYRYGCERLLDLVRDGITPVLRGEGDPK